MDKHDIKAELSKRHGSTQAFERARGLPRKSVSDVLRGRTNGRVERAIAEELEATGIVVCSLPPCAGETDKSDSTPRRLAGHRRNDTNQSTGAGQ